MSRERENWGRSSSRKVIILYGPDTRGDFVYRTPLDWPPNIYISQISGPSNLKSRGIGQYYGRTFFLSQLMFISTYKFWNPPMKKFKWKVPYSAALVLLKVPLFQLGSAISTLLEGLEIVPSFHLSEMGTAWACLYYHAKGNFWRSRYFVLHSLTSLSPSRVVALPTYEHLTYTSYNCKNK